MIQSIPYDTESKEYWRNAGAIFMRRDRNEGELRSLAHGYDVTINMGASEISGEDWPIPFYNPSRVVQAIITPGNTRRSIPEHLPPAPFDLPADGWIKRPGRGGRGKERTLITPEIFRLIPREWDIQKHIEGREFRIITVGPRVVQSTERMNPGEPIRHYQWRGLGGTPDIVKNRARAAAQSLPGTSLIGWDIMLEHETGEAYILEGNSCPGVNQPTVERIVTEINRQLGE